MTAIKALNPALFVPLALSTMTLLTACPGQLENPERFQPAVCDLDVRTEVIETSCVSGCHDATARLGNLDLQSPGLEDRLKSATSTCSSLSEPMPLVSADPAESFLVLKVKPNPPCGSEMPPGGALSREEIKCLEDFVAELAEAQ